MRPPNERAPLLLPDGAPVRCCFYAFADRGGIEDCTQESTVELSEGDRAEFAGWAKSHPRAIVGVWRIERPGPIYLCDSHERIVRETIGEGGWAEPE